MQYDKSKHSLECIATKSECNQHGVLDVIHYRWYVINTKYETFKSCDLMTCRLQCKRITYALRRLHANPSDWIKIRQSFEVNPKV